MSREFWLSGPIEGIGPLLMPVAHALLQANADLHAAAGELSQAELWHKPGGAASVGFHLKHIAGSLERLVTYAQGKPLAPGQLAALRAETSADSPPETVQELLALTDSGIENALQSLRRIRESDLLTPRAVGRAQLPSNVLGLLFHAAEHTQRHTGQVITTSKIIRGMSLAEALSAQGRS